MTKSAWKVKTFSSLYNDTLDNEINDFLKTIEMGSIIDIKFETIKNQEDNWQYTIVAHVIYNSGEYNDSGGGEEHKP